jgi:hypothetical protein
MSTWQDLVRLINQWLKLFESYGEKLDNSCPLYISFMTQKFHLYNFFLSSILVSRNFTLKIDKYNHQNSSYIYNTLSVPTYKQKSFKETYVFS